MLHAAKTMAGALAGGAFVVSAILPAARLTRQLAPDPLGVGDVHGQ